MSRTFPTRLYLAVTLLLTLAAPVYAVSPDLVISQVYGGGGNASATFTHDFVELFNRGGAPVSLAGLTVQYGGATGNLTNTGAVLAGTLNPGQYYLVRLASQAAVGAALPAHDASGGTNMAAGSGKVALVNSTSSLNCGATATACTGPQMALILDLVGYGTSNMFETTAAAGASNNTQSVLRKVGGCTETDNNNTDFQLQSPPTPRNTATTPVPCLPTLNINDVTQAETNAGTTTFNFTVSITGTAASPVTFDVATADGTTNPANAGTDYVAAPASGPSGSIPAGTNTSTTVSITVNGDASPESNETFFVNISNIVGANPGDVQGLGTISNDDSATLNIDNVTQIETESGTTNFVFTVSLTQPAPPGGVTFDVATANGPAPTATAGTDYVAVPASGPTGSIPMNGTSTTVTITVNGDTDIEPTEKFHVNITNIVGATPGTTQGLGTIVTDDIALNVSDVTAAEGNSGTQTFTFNVTLSSPAEGSGVTFDVATADGAIDPATAGSDYVAKTENGRTITAGNTSTTFTVTVNGDTAIEPNETFFVNVTNVSGAEPGDFQGLGTINNNDFSTFTIADVAVTEGNSGTQILTFTVTRSDTNGPASIDYAVVDDSATAADNDYVAVAPATLSFVNTEATKTFDVTVNGDTNGEGNEQFFVNLSNNSAGTVIGDNQALGIIFMDDPRSIAAVDTPVMDNFDVLAQATAVTTPVGWTFNETGGGARDNEQYSAETGSSGTGDTYSFGGPASPERALGGLQSGTLIPTIGAFYRNDTGTTITTLTIAYAGEQWRIGNSGTARDDRLDFQYSLDATSLTTGTWVNVDTLDFTNPIKTAGAAGPLDGNAPANRTVINNTIAGLSIPNGATFWIRFNDLDAGGADDGLAVDDFSLIANITNTLQINDVSITEGDAGTQILTFTVTRSEPSAVPTTFNITTADGTATDADNDYEVNSVVGATIPGDNTTTTYPFNVTINGDTNQESTENFFVNISNVTNAVLIDGQGVGTINADDFTLTPIHTVQGSGNTSPMNGASGVTVAGIVTGIKGGGSGGFFVQEPEANYDSDPNTSEGIFVFTAGAIPPGVAIGNRVAVTGTVTEFPAASTPHTTTELTTVSVSLLATGQPLPTAITLTTADGAATSNLSQYERYEGMRVAVTLTATVPTGGFVDEVNATGSHSGTFYGVIQGNPLAFREPGIPVNDTVPSEAACAACIPRFDRNPQRIRVTGMQQPIVVGQSISNLIGPLDYGFFEYTIISTAEPVVSGPSTFVAAPAPLASELTVSSFNLQRFFDNVDDPLQADETITTGPAYANRLNKASLAIRTALNSPDVLGVVEVENITVLQGLATKINADSGGAVNYAAYLEEGNDIGGIDVGFLVNTLRVSGITVTQLGKTATFVDPSDSSVDTLNDRPPLMLNATIQRTDLTPYAFTVIVNHLRSLNGNEGNDATGQRVRAKRAAQAEYLANLVQTRQTTNPNERIILVGDFNAFQFNDGLVDVINTIKGTPPPANEVVRPSADLVNPDLTNLVDLIPAAERYSYAFDGNLQVLDHAIVNAAMLATNTRTAFAHLDAGFPEPFRSDANRPERISDHDGIVAYFDLQPPGAFEFSAANYNVGEATTTFNVTVNRTGGSAGAASVSYTIAAGTATAGSDFTAGSGTLNFVNGETAKTFEVTIANDAIDEPDQTIALSLSTPTNGTSLGGQNTATITIQDDDAAPTLAIADLPVAETAGNALVPVTLTGATEFTVTVDFTTAPNTALAGSDYTTTSSTLTFNPGVTSQNATVPIVNDAAYENVQDFFINLTNAVNASISDSQGVVTITSEDAAPTFTISDLNHPEGSSGTTQATLVITLNGATEVAATISWNLVAGTASCCGVDFSGPDGSTTFPVGVTTRNVNITVFGDTTDEPNETVFVDLSNATGATIADNQGVLTIVDDDGAPQVIINDLSVAEGNSGTSQASLTVTLVGSSSSNVTVDWTLTAGTASCCGVDFSGPDGSFTFTPGQTTKTISATIFGETMYELDETAIVTLTNATNATISDNQGVITILNDDPLPTLIIGDVSVTEGNAGTSNATFTVTLNGSTSQTVTVNYATANNTATAGSDYTATSGTLTFAPGVLTQTFNVSITGDAANEANETYFVNLTNVTNATIADNQATGTITNDDGAPTLIIGDVTVTEGNAGTVNATFTVTLTGNTAQTVTVDYATANNTATAGSDYTAASGTLTFAPGVTTQTFNVIVSGDTVTETTESFFVNLTNATNATITDSQATGTITNDDGAPTLIIGDVTVTEGNAGTVNAIFTVTLAGSTAQTVTVDYATANNTATAGSDYTATSGTLTFNPGTTTQPITVLVTGDTLFETNETFFVNLTNATNATITDNQGLGTINDDDAVNTADLVLTQSITPPNPRAGQFITLTLTLTNNGPGTATNVVLTDNTPPGLTISTVTPSQGSCSGNPTVVCTLGTILAGANATVTIVFNPPGNAGTFNNSVSAVSAQSDPSPVLNNSQPIVVVAAAEDDVKIPTLSEWALIAMALMLAAFAALRLRT